MLVKNVPPIKSIQTKAKANHSKSKSLGEEFSLACEIPNMSWFGQKILKRLCYLYAIICPLQK